MGGASVGQTIPTLGVFPISGSFRVRRAFFLHRHHRGGTSLRVDVDHHRAPNTVRTAPRISTPRRRASLLALPYARLELPGWGKLLGLLGVMHREGWDGAPTRTIRGRNHGYLMPLDLSNWSERLTYFLGRHHEIPTAMFLQAAVRKGETFIDVGGNIGMVTLHAARLVGPTGHVHTFEPNPVMVDRLRGLIALNQIKHVTLHAAALADQAGELVLRVLHDHPGQGTLGEIPSADRDAITQEYRVPVRVGDEALANSGASMSGALTIKVDAEGYELHVFRGLRGTIERHSPAICCEVCPPYLARAGTTVDELFAFMHGLGYEAYCVTTPTRRLRHPLHLVHAAAPADLIEDNVAWLKQGSEGFDRLRRFIR
jgi:FkbM family methyltransferase